MGVRSAILKIISEINSTDDNIYVYGPLIHNPQTIEVLSSRGLRTIESINKTKGRTVAVRTHGITKNENRFLKKNAARVINLTCRRVASVQSLIKKYSSLGAFTLIVGDENHAEVTGLISYAENGYYLISDIKDIPGIPEAESYIIVSQTTFDRNLFNQIVKALPFPERTQVFDTICDSTQRRQKDVISGIDSGINTLVVVGGKNSANTARLAAIGVDHKIKTFHIETEDELIEEDFKPDDNVLVTAGASTPGWIINNVLEKLYNIRYNKGSRTLNILKRFLEFSVRTNLISAVGSFFLSVLSQQIIFSKIDYSLAFICFMYIFAMYSVNNFFERDILKKSNSYKYSLYSRFGVPFLVLSVLFFFISLHITGIHNPVFYLVSALYIIGFLYSTPPVKNSVKAVKNSFINRLYASKSVTGIGWTLIITAVPIAAHGEADLSAAAVATAVFALAFTRQLMLDRIALQSDLIMGRETIPIWIGIKKTAVLTGALFIAASSVLIIYSIYSSDFTPAIFIAALLYYLLADFLISRQNYVISLKYELLVDLNFVITAVLLFVFVI